ncbi:MAG: XamI family restriction endonuclease [Roseiflexaceae bacterium]|nr:XamI family restriction endonuclease [Roseiflexaceae bacterium]
MINADKPQLWKQDIAASVDYFNRWFIDFAPETFRKARAETVEQVEKTFLAANDLRDLTPQLLSQNPAALSTLRMCTAPPLAVDRLIGLAGVSKNLVNNMEKGKLPAKMAPALLDGELTKLCDILIKLLDRDIFPWLESGADPANQERDRAAAIIADRLCNTVSDPIIRNAQEQRQLALISQHLDQLGYRKQDHPSNQSLTDMKPGTYAFRMNVATRTPHKVNIPVDVVIQPKKLRQDSLPVFIEAKSAGDFTNTNKRRKEEATKMRQLRETYGEHVVYVLFLCGYFGSDYLGYEAAEGIDWVWEHRIDDLAQLGL